MRKEEEVVEVHPEGELQISGNPVPELGASVDTFAGKVNVRWVPDRSFARWSGWVDEVVESR